MVAEEISKSIGKSEKKWLSEKVKEAVSGYLYISPFFILFAIFGLFLFLFSFYLGFQKWNGLGEMQFIGLQNFKWILTDRIFWTSLSNTLIMWVLGSLPQVVIGIVLAYALNSALIKLKTIFRVSIFLSYVTPPVVVAIVFVVLLCLLVFAFIDFFFCLFVL